MPLFFHEIRHNRLSLIIWTSVISFMLAVCVLIYPEMKDQMSEMTDMFAEMGSLTEAFGMDELNFGEFMGYFGLECGELMGLGGVIFAALLGISALSKEEKNGTAEFLLTHPVSRVKITCCKLLSVIAQIFILNTVVASVTFVSVAATGVAADMKTMLLLFFAYFILQIEIGCITFGLSAFLHRSGVGLGIGIGILSYFINLIANLSDALEPLKYFTPFAYAEGSYIVNNCALEWKYMIPGAVAVAVSLALGFMKYDRKDIV